MRWRKMGQRWRARGRRIIVEVLNAVGFVSSSHGVKLERASSLRDVSSFCRRLRRSVVALVVWCLSDWG